MSQIPIKFTRGVPPPECFPTGQLAECARAVLSDSYDVALQYGSAGGYLPLRQWIAQGEGVAEERVVLAQGSLQLQDTLARILLRPGDMVYVEAPTYDRTLTVMRRAGAQVVGFHLGKDGPDIDELARRLRGGERPVLFYVIPDFQNPSGIVLSLEKRQRLAALAEQYGFWLVEDSPYRRLRYAGEDVPRLFDLAPERVVHMSSFSKLIAPGLRVGYAISPQPLASQLCKFSEDTYINPSYFNQAIIHEFIQRGWLEENLAALKSLYAPRLAAMVEAIQQHMPGIAEWNTPQGGFFVGMTLRREVEAAHLLRLAKEAGLLLSDGRGFFADGNGDRFIRLPFCAVTPEEIREGVGRLAAVTKNLPELTLTRSLR
jgi:DNA-binding transcriptional MocR family regulator